jgi:hypothetical protein
MSASTKKSKLPFNLVCKLEDAAGHARWLTRVQDHIFALLRHNNMDNLQPVDTLDPAFFESSAKFKSDYKKASKDASNAKVDPFHNPDDEAFPKACFVHACKTGIGFYDWVYKLYADLRGSLSDTIQDKTSGVPRGDLVGLFKAIKLAVLHHEAIDSDDLYLQYTSASMAIEGQNDVMMFLSKIAVYLQRLEAAEVDVPDARKQRVLLKGLNQDVFENFIDGADRQAYPTYEDLKVALVKAASKPRMLAKLQALQPGRPQSEAAFATVARTFNPVPAGGPPDRLDRLEALIIALTESKGRRAGGAPHQHVLYQGKQPCRNHANGTCREGSKCTKSHDPAALRAFKYCDTHKYCGHTTPECTRPAQASPSAGASVHATTVMGNGYEFTMATRVCSQAIFALQQAPKIDRVCVDGASTTHGTYDRSRCTNITGCHVSIHSINSDSKDHIVCTEMGDMAVSMYNAATGSCTTVLLKKVLISESFPFHVFSEILAFEQRCTATKELNSWQFYTPRPDSKPLFHASQQLLRQGESGSHGSSQKLYFIDEQPADDLANHAEQELLVTTLLDKYKLPPGMSTKDQHEQQATVIAAVATETAVFDQAAYRQAVGESLYMVPAVRAAVTPGTTPQAQEQSASGGQASVRPASAPAAAPAAPMKARTISTAKNLKMLLELHCAHDHWNFEAVAKQYGLTLPNPLPECWACLISKPRYISHDKFSTRQTSRVCEGLAADAKGPFNTPTPEGYLYYFLIVCLYSHFYWCILTKSQSSWADIWPDFVKRWEAKVGHQRCISFVLTDGHKVHSAKGIQDFNAERGIESITTAPHSQWQDPAERGIQTITNAARTSMIHGGAKAFMWGWAIRHATDSVNRMRPPQPIAGHEGKSRLRIAYPSVPADKEMRTHKPFLSLCFKSKPKNERGSNMEPRAEPCVYLLYDRTKKAYALLTLPNLYLTWSIEVRFVTGAFPLRVTDYLANQLDTFLRPSVEDDMYRNIHGPGNVLRRHRLENMAPDRTMVVEQTPTIARGPVTASTLPGPGHSSTRGYTPSAEGLRSIASIQVTTAAPAAQASAETYTPDQLAERTPRTIYQALRGPDRDFWMVSILRDHAIMRENECVINITTVCPPGRKPPAMEQRFTIKHYSDTAIALADIEAKDWKTRSLVRGDRFERGVQFDETAAPVVALPSIKVLLCWAVAKNLLAFEWDQGNAFYVNEMEPKGIVVQLCPGYDPYSTNLRSLDLPPLYGELAKAVPGIPQGSLLHYNELSAALQGPGLKFKPIDPDNCLFLHEDMDMATSLHVDDGILVCPSFHHAEMVLGPNGLGANRKITWGPLSKTLNIEWTVSYSAERRVIFMNQRAYAVTILERAGLLDCNPAQTPASAGRKYTKEDCPVTEEDHAALRAQGLTKKHYHSIVAALNYLVCTSRDDMRFIQGKISKYCQNPGMEHFHALKRALRYLKGTLDYGIEFSWCASDPAPSDGPLNIVAWSDSSFADDVDTARTTLGTVIQINGATVSASSKLSARVDSCVNHSELHAFGAATGPLGLRPAVPEPGEPTDGAALAMMQVGRTVTWVRGIKAALERRDITKMPPTPVHVDNSGVIAMLNNNIIKTANKHIYRTLAENRERVHLDKFVKPVKIDTHDNIANALTKQEPGYVASAAQLRQLAGPISN